MGARPPGLAALWVAARRDRCPAAARSRAQERAGGDAAVSPVHVPLSQVAGDTVGLIKAHAIASSLTGDQWRTTRIRLLSPRAGLI
jgi:hypothetical protein